MSKKRSLLVLLDINDLRSRIAGLQSYAVQRKTNDYREEKLRLLLVIKERSAKGETLQSAELAAIIRDLSTTEHGKKVSATTIQKWIETFFYKVEGKADGGKMNWEQIKGDTKTNQEKRLVKFLLDKRKLNKVVNKKVSSINISDFNDLFHKKRMKSMTFTDAMLLYKEKNKHTGKDISFSLSTFIRFAKKHLMGQRCTGWNMKFKVTHEKRQVNRKEESEIDARVSAKFAAFKKSHPMANLNKY
jgi:hypothetical protein